MKKFFFRTLVLALICVSIMSCGKDSDAKIHVGTTWIETAIGIAGQDYAIPSDVAEEIYFVNEEVFRCEEDEIYYTLDYPKIQFQAGDMNYWGEFESDNLLRLFNNVDPGYTVFTKKK